MCNIVSCCNFASTWKGRREVKMGSITPWREGRAQQRDLLLGGNELGVSTLPERSDRAEGNLLFLGAQWADKRKGTSQIALLMVISIGCACMWYLTKEGTFILTPDSSVLSFSEGWRKNLAILTGSEWEAFKATLVATLGEGRHRVIPGEGDLWRFRDIPFPQPLLWVHETLVDPSEMEEAVMQRERKEPSKH